MAYSGTSSTSLSKLLPTYYNRKFLHRGQNTMVLEQLGQQKPLPKNEGKVVYFSRYLNLSPKTTALTEGTLPTVDELSSARVSATVAEYGNYTKITTFVSDTAIDPNIAHASEIMGYNAGQTKDRLIITELGTFGTAQCVAGKSNVSELTNVSDFVFTAAEARKAKRTLGINLAMMYDGGYFAGVMDDSVIYDWTGDSDFVEAARYAGSTKLFNGEVGKWMGIRWVKSTEVYREDISGTASTTGAVHSTHVMGKEAFGVVPLGGSKSQIYVKRTNNNDTSQPIPRYHTVGWLGTWTQRVLNANYVINVKSRVTA